MRVCMWERERERERFIHTASNFVVWLIAGRTRSLYCSYKVLTGKMCILAALLLPFLILYCFDGFYSKYYFSNINKITSELTIDLSDSFNSSLLLWDAYFYSVWALENWKVQLDQLFLVLKLNSPPTYVIWVFLANQLIPMPGPLVTYWSWCSLGGKKKKTLHTPL